MYVLYFNLTGEFIRPFIDKVDLTKDFSEAYKFSSSEEALQFCCDNESDCGYVSMELEILSEDELMIKSIIE